MRERRPLPQWQRATLASCAAGGLLLAVSIHFSRSARESEHGTGHLGFAGIESLQGGGIGSMDDEADVKLRQAGEYTRGFLLASQPGGKPGPGRSRNFPVTMADAPHVHLSLADVPHAAAAFQGLAGESEAGSAEPLAESKSNGTRGASPMTPVEYIKQTEKKSSAQNADVGQKEEVADGIQVASDKEESKSMLRCKNMAHVHNLRLLSSKDVSIGMYLLNMELLADEAGVFYADFLMFLRQHDHPMHLIDGSDPWDSIGFANAKDIDLIQTFGNAKGLRRIQGTFFFSPDLRWYPFDRQNMDITVEQIKFPVTEWVFLPDWNLNGISSTIRFPGWQATLRDPGTDLGNCGASVDIRTMPGAVKIGMSKESNVTFSTFTYTIQVLRPPAQVSI